jgi:DNA/RNA endonuclease YhcR with UshA esterase domain
MHLLDEKRWYCQKDDMLFFPKENRWSDEKRTTHKPKKAKNTKGIAALLVVMLAAVAGGYYFTTTTTTQIMSETSMMTSQSSIMSSETPMMTATMSNTQWQTPTAPVVSWTDASSYVGQTVAVQGTIVYTYYSSSSGTSFLDFHYPYQGYFYGVVFSSDAGNFRCSITNFYLNQEVRITGMVQLYNGAPEIIVHSPSQIEVAYEGFPCS